ncbi:hypothetical protein [Neobacillus niacini]|uniref:hypothetical protein n=1 Tax=Neobacillus niacini TaxID=86668 RepID=UPI002041B12A|nr:hypothetical protein [Neobacillus niacini]MCM3692185.1 hypothetical protein [Neobacillus niacini]
MENNELIETSEKAFTTKDVAMMADFSEPTVKKYAQALEVQGYQFAKSKRGKIEVRMFVERDILYLRKMFEMSKKTNADVKSLAQMVMVDVGNKKKIQTVTDTELTPAQIDFERYENRFQEIENTLKSLKKIDTLQTELKTVQEQNDLLKKMNVEMGKTAAQKLAQHDHEVNKLNNELQELKKFIFQITLDQRKSNTELKKGIQKILEQTGEKIKRKKGIFGWFK